MREKIGKEREAIVFSVLFNGARYRIVPIGVIDDGWAIIDTADNLSEGYAKSKRDWEYFWSLCGPTPSRPISITFA